MKPLSIHLKGIGSHKDTFVDFTKYRSPIALCAVMGSGKTFLIEGIFAALFGRGLWYGSIYDMMTKGGTGKSSIELYFEHKGKRYLIERNLSATAKTQTQTAILWSIEIPKMFGEEVPYARSVESHSIAGPKIGDFDRAIGVLIGDWATASATWYLGQNRLGDLVGTPGDGDVRARRRELMHRFLGAEEIASHCQRASAALTGALIRAGEIDAQLLDVPDFGAEIEAAEIQKLVAVEGRLLCETQITIHEQARGVSLESLAQLDAGDTHHRAAIERHALAREKARAAAKAVTDIGADISRLECLAARGETARQDLATRKSLEVQREEMRLEVAKWDDWRDWENRRRHLTDSEGAAQRRMEAAGETPLEVDDETRAMAGQVEEIEAEYRKNRAGNQAVQEMNNVRRAERQEIGRRLSGYNHQIAEYSRQIEAAPKVPCGAELGDVCPLMAEFNGLDSKLVQAENHAVADMEKLEAIPPDDPLVDLDEIAERGKAAREAGHAVNAAAAAGRVFDIAKDDYETAALEFMRHRDAEPPKPATENPQETIGQLQRAIDDLAGAQERIEQAERARADLEAKRAGLPDAKAAAGGASIDAEGLRAAADSACQALENQAAERERLQKGIDVETLEIERLNRECARLAESIGHHAGRIEALERGLSETGAKRDRLQALRADAAALEDIKRCFSNQGVRQILIDDAVPGLEVIANRLFMLATDGRQQLRISTQRQTQAGHLAEDFAIMVKDQWGEREVAGGYCGGELELIRIIFRIAVIIWQGNIRGHQPGCLVLDEAFDSLGDEYPMLLKVLESLGQQYEMIIAVTHDRIIANQMASRIVLEKGIRGTRIVEGRLDHLNKDGNKDESKGAAEQ